MMFKKDSNLSSMGYWEEGDIPEKNKKKAGERAFQGLEM